MPTLFVSHSSKDDVAASVLAAWLRANGFTDIFVDHHSIAGGEKWREALRAAAGACRVVVSLVSESWLASHECFDEFRAAWYMGKRIIPLFLPPPQAGLEGVAKSRLAEVCAEDQGVDLRTCVGQDGRLDLDADRDVGARLKMGLRSAGAMSRVGLDPEAFAIDRVRRPTPFPGLVSFGDDDADAALFYGRSREIADTLEELRKMRAERDLRPFMILGASGAGKSSLLKAGIIPRLRREVPAWLPLRAFRPGADPLLNFAEALARTYADFGRIEAHGVIRDRLLATWSEAGRGEAMELTPAGLQALDEALEAEGRTLREAAGQPSATILIAVDQAEEMVRSDGDSGEALADFLRVALTASASPWQVAFTIRADSFPELQRHRRFQALSARGYDLRAIPVFRFDTVVEEPAKRYGVTVEDVLVDALMEDAPKEDALPLLAFALQRLWRQYAASGMLTKESYVRVGGLTGLIEDAAERALRGLEPDQDVPLPSGAPAKRLASLGAATFVPALAQLNEKGNTIRRVAAWNSFNDEQQDLLARFDRWRLLVRKGRAEGGTIEVAHEALFREWTRLRSWLEPARAQLDALRSLEVDAATWDRNGRDAAFLNHRNKRLAEARTLAGTDAYRERLGKPELDYLDACRAAERSAQRRTRRTAAAVGVLALGVAASVAGWLNQSYIEEQVRWFAVARPYLASQFWPYVRTAAAERALQAGDSFRECATDCPEMVVVPAGEFMMGSPDGEAGRFDSEGPQHRVTIAEPFAVSRFDVTFDEWDACAAYGDCAPHIQDEGWGRGRRPAINVSWGDAQRYVAWLSRTTGKGYRLLSEAEWEYAARAGTETAYAWGNAIGTGNASCATCGSRWDGKQTAPVGSFAPNKLGLYDALGNVWQWVEDCFHPTYDGAPQDGSAWTADSDCSRRVVRGGSWNYPPRTIRAAARFGKYSVNRYNYLGFRIGRTLTR